MRSSPYPLRLGWTVAVLWAGLLSSPASADTAQGASQASVVEPIQIVKTADLEFGTIPAHSTGIGRVTINARTGARTSNANTTPIGATGFGRATFQVTGEPLRQVNLTTSSPSIALTGPGTPMTVNQLRVNRNNGGQGTLPRTYQIPVSGTMQVGFGGRLNIPANQTPGTYAGVFDLTVTYQ